jgi:hypothetical protein
MSSTSTSASPLKSIGAVLAGAVASVAPTLGTDFLMHSLGLFPAIGTPMTNSGPLLLATGYRTIYGVLGAYVTARLAPRRPMLHALILGAIGLAVSIFGAAFTWNKGPAFGPHWYPVALCVLALPQCWAGAKLFLMQQRAPSQT